MNEETKHLFYMSTHCSGNTYYLHFRADIYIAVGCDAREYFDYGFMQEFRLKPNEVRAVSKDKVSLWSDMSVIALEALITGIMVHNP